MFLLNVSENILLFFSAFGALQGTLLAAVLYFHPKSDRSVTRFLALYIFFLSIPSIILVGQYVFTWLLIIFVQPFLVLIGPLLYLYIRSFREVITWKKAWPHFILFVLFLLTSYWFYAEVGTKYPPQVAVPKEVPEHPLYYVQIIIRSVQRIVYFFLAYRVLIFYQRSIRHLFSDTSRINLQWVKWLINGYLVLVLSIISLNILILQFPESYSLFVLIIALMVTIYVYLAAMKGISQPTLWQVHSNMNKEKIEEEIKQAETIELKQSVREKNKQRKVGLDETKMEELILRIHHILQAERLYQEPELTLQNLADKLQLPPYQVSQALNDGMKKNFYDLINGYRVEEAKRLLLDAKNKNFTILSVGFDAGFNSKTTFNTVFKKFTGLTPTGSGKSSRQFCGR